MIGIGNELRCDDGIGPAVAAEIQRRKIPGVRVVLSHGEPIGLLDAWTGVRLAVVIDAVVCEPASPVAPDRCRPFVITLSRSGHPRLRHR